MGDRVLVQTASIFQSMIRKQDWVGRWGGEEFLIIVPGPSDVQTLAERVRDEVANARFVHGSQSFGITVSIGVASVKHDEPIDQVLRDADTALYHAKQTKNTISLAA
jgi:diguanylate cyclase (GGDEF)-like protein